MKTIPPLCPEPEVGPKYWRSLDQLSDTPEFRQWMEREFPAGASEFTDPIGRRHFVKIMSASFLLAGLGLTGCRRPEETILPFSKQPENYIHGVPQFFATARPSRGGAVPLLVKSNDGRPTKVEGNNQHPANKGGTDTFSQASILNLYDPDRGMRFTRSGNAVPRKQAEEYLAAVGQQFAGTSGGEGLSFLLERSSSPTRVRLQRELSQKLPKARWYVYEPVDFDIHHQAASAAFGQNLVPEYRLDKAQRILALDCDFLGAEEDSWRMIRGFTQARKVEKPSDTMNRLYVVEGLFSLTGANADHRLRVAPSQVLAVAAALAQEIATISKTEIPGVAKLAELYKGDRKWISECATDLMDHHDRGGSVVMAGYQQPLAVHLLAYAINNALGAVGKSVVLQAGPVNAGGSLAELVQQLNAGAVNTLVCLGGNVAYNAPADLNWAQAVAKAKEVVQVGYYEDESSVGTAAFIPEAHYLESWGDARTGEGTYTPIQPLIAPLFDGMTHLEVLARIGNLTSFRPYDHVRDTFRSLAKGVDFEEAWKKCLHDGYLPETALPSANVQLTAGALAQALGAAQVLPAPSKSALEVIFHRDYSVDDGRYTNNGWLQETPDPITKVVWENTIMVSPKTAQDLGLTVVQGRQPDDLKNNDKGLKYSEKFDILKIEIDGRSVEGPVWVQPGMADNVVALALGYGREKVGRVGAHSGYNAYKVRTHERPYIAAGAKVSGTGRHTRVVSTQEHGSMEGRPIVREANLAQFKQKPDFAKNMDLEAHAPNAGPIYEHPYKTYENGKKDPSRPDESGLRKDRREIIKDPLHQWAMVIDLSTCIGCSACMVACQSENNVPIVGKEQVDKGREMHWLRMDRYFAGDVNDPQMSTQPMLCQHCENAPCESVCPVNATVHDEQGLNIMAYNRCVGTRYCSNNCPYKVRRFNFFDYNKRSNDYAVVKSGWLEGELYKGPLGENRYANPEWDIMKLLRNPDVSVRMRGVMEKCTFCVQRIEGAKITQKVKAGASGDVQVKEGTFTTACAQACPSDAIVFGNLADKESVVAKLRDQNPRNYSVLGFLDTMPRLTYLARIRNPNPAMPNVKEYPLSLEEYSKAYGDPIKPHGGHENSHAAPAHGSEHTQKGAH